MLKGVGGASPIIKCIFFFFLRLLWVYIGSRKNRGFRLLGGISADAERRPEKLRVQNRVAGAEGREVSQRHPVDGGFSRKIQPDF